MKSNIINPNQRLKKLLKKIHLEELKLDSIHNARLAFGVSSLSCFAALSVWPATPSNPIVYLAFAFLILFLFTLRISLKKKRFLLRLKCYFSFLERQKLRATGTPQSTEAPYKKAQEDHYTYPSDLGLFGDHSMSDLLNETWSSAGYQNLISHFASKDVSNEIILFRQHVIKSLKQITWPLIRLRLEMQLESKHSSNADLFYYLTLPVLKKSPALIVSFIFLFWISWLLVIFFGNRDLSAFPWVTLSFPLTNLYLLKRWSEYYQALVGLTYHLEKMMKCFQFIEQFKTHFAIQSELPKSCEQSPLLALKQLNIASLFLGTQTNSVLHLILNALAPWSALGALLAHRSLRFEYLKDTLGELPNLESLVSFAVFTHYQTQNYPEITDSSFYFEEMYHPLIPKPTVVSNNFSLPDNTRVVLITGSNMSGKSTFLRTIGINQMLANMGLPVFAKKFVTFPVQIQTCIQVTDSIRDGFSYFYAEVKKLSYINQLALSNHSLLILVDELFRGTNNTERRAGSRALIKKWASLKNSVTFISTHDLELAQEAQNFLSVSCFHFKDEVDPSTGLMHFDYKIYNGPCRSTNAIKIMLLTGLITNADLQG